MSSLLPELSAPTAPVERPARLGEGLGEAALERIAQRFAVLGEPARLRLLAALDTEELTVNTLVERTGLTQANTSRHLQMLAQAGILARRKEGVQVFYRIADATIFDLCHIVCGALRTEARRWQTELPPEPPSR